MFPLAMPTNQQLPALGNLQTGSSILMSPPSSMTAMDLSSSSISISEGESSQAHSTVSTSRQLIPSTIGEIGLTPPPQNSVNMVTQNLLPPFNTTPIVSQMGSTPPVYNSVNLLPQNQSPSVINGSVSKPPVFSTSVMTTPNYQTGSRMLMSVPSSVASIDLSSSSIVISEGQSSQAHNTVSAPRQLITSTIGGIGLTSSPHNSVDMVTQNLLQSLNSTPDVFQVGSTPPVYNAGNVLPQRQLLSVINGFLSRPSVFSTAAMTTPNSSILFGVFGTPPTSSMVSPVTMVTLTPSNTIRLGRSATCGVVSTPSTPSMVPPDTFTSFPSSAVFSSGTMTAPGLSLRSSGPWIIPSTSITQSVTMPTQSFFPRSVSRPVLTSALDFSSVERTTQDSYIVPGNNLDMGSVVFSANANDGESSTTRENEVFDIDVLEPSGHFANVLPNATVDRELLQETEMSDMSWIDPHLQVWIF